MSGTVFSQGFLKKLKEKAANVGSDLITKKGAQKTEQVIDGATKKGNGNKDKSGKVNDEKRDGGANSTQKANHLASYSKFDFVPGDKIVYAENFDQDVIGEFPLKWFTNGSAEVVTVDGLAGRWLKLVSGRTLTPTVKFPPNFTFEYDLLVNLPVKTTAVYPAWQFQIYDGGDKALKLSYGGHKLNNMLNFKTRFPAEYADVKMDATEKGIVKLNTEWNRLRDFSRYYGGGVVHVAMTVQGERFRMWFNDEKVMDVPTAVALNHSFNQIQFEAAKVREGYPAFYVGNIKLAEGKADTRSKLMDEGRFVTTGIQFDSGSDKIKPISTGIIKEIAAALKDNAIQVRIIGHTDDEGGAESNLLLSKKRAEAVKKMLVDDYGISEISILTDGKGAGQPVGDNKTSTGKAQNRRVEFVKV
ncbi:hypothetical protein DBR11_23965 [Pedobacter sp. HMWF019]|nr:hypothetical protein DBR11_23965 [Pedobacter sp. HMWF019]